MGNDWVNKFDHLRKYCDVVYLDRTDGVSTSDLKRRLGLFSNINREDLLLAFDTLEILRRDLE